MPTPMFSCWMKSCHAKRLPELWIPGSHNSLSYRRIDPGLKYDNPTWKFSILHWVYRSLWSPEWLRTWINNWTQCQATDVSEQLERGVRCLDFRVVSRGSDTFGYHTFISCPLSPALEAVASFVLTHPTELLLIRYESNSWVCDEQVWRAWSRFLVANHHNLLQLSLGAILRQGQIILLTEKSTAPCLRSHLFTNVLSHSWLDTWGTEEKREHVRSTLFQRSGKLKNADWTLTPNWKSVLLEKRSLLYHSAVFNQSLTIPEPCVVSVDNEASVLWEKIVLLNY